MDNGKGGADNNGRHETNRTALTILSIVVIALICITVITLVSMGKRLWGDVSGAGTAALTDLTKTGATGTTPSLGTSAPENVTPSTGNNGSGANAANPGKIISGIESGGETKDAAADSADGAVDVSEIGGKSSENAGAENSGGAAEVGAGPAEPVKDGAPVFTAPIYGVIAKPHDQSVAVYSLTMDDYRVHLGVDIEANLGDPVYSSADGVVSAVKNDPFMGTCVEITHGNGYVTYYKNLAPALPAGVAEGMAVTGGQIIGLVGESAALEVAESAHLHFELTIGGVAANPADYMAFPAAAAQTFNGE